MTLRLAGFVCVFLLPFLAFSQNPHDPELWNNIVSAIDQKKSLVTVFNQLEVIKTGALQQKDYTLYARSRFYQMLITDTRSEDSGYFQNSTFIDSILWHPASPTPLKGIMHIMQGRRLVAFYNRSLRFNKARYQSNKLPVDYAAFPHLQLDSIIQFHFEQAKNMLADYKEDDPTSYGWLSSNPLIFLFKPALFDVIVAEQIDFFANRSFFNKTWAPSFAEWISGTPAEFIHTLDTAIQNKAKVTVALKLYQEWLASHKKDSAIHLFIESLARKYIYYLIPATDSTEVMYEKYLLAGTESPFREVKAHAVYQLCLLWNKRANQPQFPNPFPPSKALQLYENNKQLFDDFTCLGRILEIMRAQILQAEITWGMTDRPLPNEPLLAKIGYKNVSGLHYKIFPLSQDDILSAKKDSAIMDLLNKPCLRSVSEQLPLPDDRAKHRTFLKLDPLPAGRYGILFAQKPFAAYDADISMVTIDVSQIAILPSNNRVYVLNKKNGMPLQGARASVTFEDGKQTGNYTINRQGYIEIKRKEKYTFTVAYGKDTLSDDARAPRDDLYDQVYDKESDDLLDFYTDKMTIHILTDRSIYRPGQTVFYKAILMTKDPFSGAQIILTKKNLQQGLFKNWLKQWLKEEEPEIYITDPFSRKIDTILVQPNAYGSFTGSFHIPVTAATGEWSFETDIESDSWHPGAFSVEEYKRPSFELTAVPPVKTFLPGDPVEFKLKVRSFAGALLANTRISYLVSRNVPSYFTANLPDEMEVEGIVLTDRNGEALIRVPDTALQNAQLPDSVKWTFRYELTATATDLSGESHEISQTLKVSSQPVAINLPVRGNYFINDFKPILVTAKDPNQVALARQIQVKVFRQQVRSADLPADYSNFADQWIYPVAQLEQWFPQAIFRSVPNQEQQELVYETTIHTGAGEKIRIPAALLTTGNYTMQAACYEKNILRGEEQRSFVIYDLNAKDIPSQKPSFIHVPVNDINAGDSLSVNVGSGFDSTFLLLQLTYYSRQKKKLTVIPVFTETMIDKGIHSFKFPIPKDATDQALVTSLFVRNNEVYRHREQIWINRQEDHPVIIIEQFRNKLTPGEQTTFSVSIKTKDHNVAAELMSTMYDASLDKLEKHTWGLPQKSLLEALGNDWPEELTGTASGKTVIDNPMIKSPANKVPVWWMQGAYYQSAERRWDIEYEETGNSLLGMLQGRVAGLSITSATGIDEVVVVGYGTTTKRMMTASISMISSRGPIQIPDIKQEPVVKIRSNFNESAFFYPAMHADRDGYYRFTFTVPESLTEWNWKLFAHTKKAQFAYAERKLNTQLPFMIQPNMPRLLYQGDQILLKSRISNLDSIRMTGKAVCKVEDAVTGEDLTAGVVKHAENMFDVAGQSNAATGFLLNIPAGQLNPLKIIIKAVAQAYSDGEEYIIPVLTDKVLVKQAVPFRFSQHTDTLISLPACNNLYGIGLSIQAKPNAALINSLAFLANYSFDCAEQTFNKMQANITAFDMMRTDKATQKMYETARQAIEKAESPALLPGSIDEQTMPWLQLSSQTALQQKQLFALLDTVRTKGVIENHLGKLYKLQNQDGGLCWFEGGNSDPYISAYVLAGFGKLPATTWKAQFLKEEKTRDLISRLIQYVDSSSERVDLFNVYARAYWKEAYPVSPKQYTEIDHLIKQEWQHVDNATLYHQALLIIATMRWLDQKNDYYNKALTQLDHIRQQAIEDRVNGIRWKVLADANEMNISTEETLALLTEAFGQSTPYPQLADGIVTWLLTSKTDHRWGSTKAAAAAINLLQQTQKTITGNPQTISTALGNKGITVTNDLLHGQPFSFTKTATAPDMLSIKKADSSIGQGAIIACYFASISQLNQLNKDIQLAKHFYWLNDATKNWEAVGDNTLLKVGSTIKVVVNIETSANLQYVYIDDKTGGAFQSTDFHSGYEYQKGLSYYRSVRDAGQQFFVNFIPAGKTKISYELQVTQEGTFTIGPSILQCMYKPEKTAYSNSVVVKATE